MRQVVTDWQEQSKLHVQQQLLQLLLSSIAQQLRAVLQSIPCCACCVLRLQMLLGLHHMHSRKVLHRDMKTLNTFLDQQLNVKLGDLGVAKVGGAVSSVSSVRSVFACVHGVAE
jgi:serine/threonine protein kinase